VTYERHSRSRPAVQDRPSLPQASSSQRRKRVPAGPLGTAGGVQAGAIGTQTQIAGGLGNPTPTGIEDPPTQLPGEDMDSYGQRLAEWRRRRVQRTAFLGLTEEKPNG
jgi:hypothetical protein